MFWHFYVAFTGLCYVFLRIYEYNIFCNYNNKFEQEEK